MTIPTSPPRSLYMDEYQSDWKPKGWQLIIIGPTSTWRQDWGEWEAIRDIVQNALDECEHYTWGYDKEGLYIKDDGKGIAIADFLLGPPKLKPDYARGKFGEGMKIASLALIRLGYSVHVETVGRELWMIFLKQKTNGHTETLSALWRTNERQRGTIFHIIGYTGTAFEDRFAINLPRKSIIAEGPSQLIQPVRRFNQLIKHDFVDSTGEKKKSQIFARDIYMCDIASPYSYNLWSFDLAPDRFGPKEESDMWADIGRLWCCITKVELLQEFLQMVKYPPILGTDESYKVDIRSWRMGYEPVTGKEYASFVGENASSWREAWRNVMGEDAVIRTDDRLDSMVKHLGYNSVSVQDRVYDTLSRAIMTDRQLVQISQERLREVEIIPDDHLDSVSLKHLKLARAIATNIFPTPPPVYVANIPPASDRVRTAGMYSPKTGEVYISSEMMARCRTMIDTLVHELAHHRQYIIYGEAGDLTPSHAECMTHIATNVVEITSKRELDNFLKGVIW